VRLSLFVARASGVCDLFLFLQVNSTPFPHLPPPEQLSEALASSAAPCVVFFLSCVVPLESRRRLPPQAPRYIQGSSHQAPQPPLGSVPCECVLVSPLLYKPSVFVCVTCFSSYR